MKQTVRAMTGCAYALDIGGTKIAASIVNGAGQLLVGPIKASCPQDSRDSVVAACLALLRQLSQRSEASSLRPIAVGVSTGGTISRDGRVLYATSSIPDWQGCPLREIIAKEMGLPVVVCNDGNCAAVAEARLGSGAACESTLCLTVGTGLGGGVVMNSELVCGSERMAQCFGHMVVCRDGRRKGENAGAAESYVSGQALCERYNERVEAAKRAASGKEVGERAEAGEAEAVACVKEMGEWLGVALASMCACLNPEVVCIGGSVADLGELFLAPARVLQAERLRDDQGHADCEGPVRQRRRRGGSRTSGSGALLDGVCLWKQAAKEITPDTAGSKLARANQSPPSAPSRFWHPFPR